MSDNILEVRGLKQYFYPRKATPVKAVDGVSFNIRRGTTYGLVGESGSGKTTIGRSIIRLYTPTEGSIVFEGREIAGRLDKSLHSFICQKMQMIFQDPMASLNPRSKVIDIVAQGLDINHLCKSREEREKKVMDMLERVELSREHANRYPHMFSGGQRQRIGIARAMVMDPDLIIADEPISALDVSIQAQVINLMKQLQREMGTTYLFIAHDLSMVKYISDEIGVLHLGHMVETGTKDEIFSHPVHPYTRSLLSAIPIADPEVEKTRTAISYNYFTSGIDYNKGQMRSVGGTHQVLSTEAEFEKWMNETA
ncbi:MAG: ABC transporter ATP-binding protein [Clostridia bacterium]|nr:ABC transporter ATP-binding protein [Clostridia bacterium]